MVARSEVQRPCMGVVGVVVIVRIEVLRDLTYVKSSRTKC